MKQYETVVYYGGKPVPDDIFNQLLGLALKYGGPFLHDPSPLSPEQYAALGVTDCTRFFSRFYTKENAGQFITAALGLEGIVGTNIIVKEKE